MSDNSQMIEQIFSNIDAIGASMESTVDLGNDVAPFMSTTLAKIKQLALAKSSSYEAQYELFQIATNYLPRTINAYCALPIEYRNTRIIKMGKTARQLLVEDLKIIKKQVLEIEKLFYEAIESQIKINSTLVRNKYDNQFQLATEIEQFGEDGFVNQFEFSTYQSSSNYKNITFKKIASEKETLKMERKENFNKAISSLAKTTKNLVSAGYTKSTYFIKNIKKLLFVFIRGAFNVFGGLLGIIIGSCIFVGFILGIITLIGSLEKPLNLYRAFNETSMSINQVMSINLIPTSEFSNFVNLKKEEMLDDSGYRKKHTKVSFDENTRVVTIEVNDLKQGYCMALIDKKESGFDFSSVKVNGMEIPQDNTVSDRTIIYNENHKLCHLIEGNKVSVEFDNQKIYNAAKNPLTAKEKEAKIVSIKDEIIFLKNAQSKIPSDVPSYKSFSVMIDSANKVMQRLDTNLVVQ